MSSGTALTLVSRKCLYKAAVWNGPPTTVPRTSTIMLKAFSGMGILLHLFTGGGATRSVFTSCPPALSPMFSTTCLSLQWVASFQAIVNQAAKKKIGEKQTKNKTPVIDTMKKNAIMYSNDVVSGRIPPKEISIMVEIKNDTNAGHPK